METADIARWGTTHAGRQVHRITLRNATGMEVALLDYGGIVAEILAPDRRGRLGNIVLGCASLAEYETLSPYFGALVGRYANRIADARFELDGETFSLPANDGPNTLHGGQTEAGTPDFSHRVWDIVSVLGNAVTLRLESPDGENGFPGDLTVYAAYTLGDDNALRLAFTARVAGRPTVLNLTSHGYFNLAGSGSALDHRLWIGASRYLPAGPGLIPTGAIEPVAGTPMDFRTPAPAGARIGTADPQLRDAGGYDHCYVLDKPEDALGPAALLHDPVSGRTLAIETTEPGLQLYTGNNLGPAIPGHGGAPCRPGAGIALETQHFPDSPNRPDFPSTRLDPGEAFRSTTIWRFGTDTAPT